ncbi:site-specific integrase [Desulfovirgula thermocuniculi]|uniref:site-specific integrase n=1 Tax=Desulfovirgula thermocuniculi TaxID=348842 RepID=UPI00040A2A0A|nr:site-specific integrase [Desulfovirgula thermocuniculi]
MPGHLEKRSNKSWTIVVELGRDPVTGKRKRLKKAFRGTKKEAEKELARLLTEIEKGTYVEPTKLTFGEYLLRWLDDYCRPNLAPSTFDSYQRIIKKHIIPALGAIPMAKLQPMHLQSYYSEKLGALAQRTVQYHHRIIREALNHAMKWQLIPRNVADAVQAPRAKRPEISVPGLQEIKQLLEAARDHQDYALICTAIFTGMRRAELLGLKWEDVDTNTGTISVRRTLQRLPETGFIFTEPKSQKSRRQVLIPPVLVEILKEHRRRQLENRMRLGEKYQDHGLVFPRQDGQPEDPSNISHRFKALVDKLGLSGLRFHDLRHLHATILLAQGVHPKVVQERLGHQTVTLTLDTYSHVIPTIQKEVVEKLQDLFGHQTGTKKA